MNIQTNLPNRSTAVTNFAVELDELGGSLVKRITMGDRHAEDEVWRRYSPALKSTLRAFTRCPADVDDWLSMVWMQALPKLRAGRLRKPSALRGFLKVIAKRVARRDLERRKRVRLVGDVEASTTFPLPKNSETPQWILECGERENATLHALRNGMSTDDNLILLLRYYYEWSVGEVASYFGISTTVCSNRLYRAKGRAAKLQGIQGLLAAQ